MNRPFSGLNRAECVSLMKRYPLSIGILAGQWLKLGEYLQTLRALEQPVLHLDLMDGHFALSSPSDPGLSRNYQRR